MKSAIFNLTVVAMLFMGTLSLTSCALILHGSKAKLGLLNAPNDLEVTNVATGEKLKIQMLSIDASKSGNEVTFYIAPAVRVKATKNLTLAFKSGGVTVTKVFRYKSNIGFLVFETFLTIGIGTTVDLVTGANRELKPKEISVVQLFADSAQVSTPRASYH